MKSLAAELFNLQQADKLSQEDKDRITVINAKLNANKVNKPVNTKPRKLRDMPTKSEALALIDKEFNGR